MLVPEYLPRPLALFMAIFIFPLQAHAQAPPQALEPLIRSFDAYQLDLERLDNVLNDVKKASPNLKDQNISPLLKELQPPLPQQLPRTTQEVSIQGTVLVSLEQAVAIALQNNPSLQQKIAEVTQSQGLLRSVRGRLYPSLSMQLGASYDQEGANYWAWKSNQYIFSKQSPFYVPDGGWLTFQSNESIGFAKLSLNYDLVSFQRTAALAASKQDLVKAEQAYGNQLRQLQLDVSEAFYTLQLEDQKQRIRQVTVDNNQVIYDQIDNMKTVGLVPRVDLLRAKANLEQSKFLLQQAKANFLSAERLLSNLINVPFDITLRASQSVRLQPPWPFDMSETLIRGFENNPQLLELQAARKALLNRADQQAAKLLPTVGLFAMAGFDASISEIPRLKSGGCCGASVVPGLNQTSADWSAGLVVKWDLFDAGITAGAVEATQAAAERTLQEEAETRNKIRQDLESSFYQHKAALSLIIAANSAYEAAREAYRDTRARFEFGFADYTDLSDTIRSLTLAMEQRAEAITLANVSYAQLLRQLIPVPFDPTQSVELPIVVSNLGKIKG